jgi:hypothetical protein
MSAWVIRVTLAVRRPLPVLPWKRTSSGPVAMSGRFRSSPDSPPAATADGSTLARSQGAPPRARVDRPSAFWRCGYKRRRHPGNLTARCVLYRIGALLQDRTTMIAASTATNHRRPTPLGFEAALSHTATEASARACASSAPAASEAVTSWAGSARKPSRARALSLPGWP